MHDIGFSQAAARPHPPWLARRALVAVLLAALSAILLARPGDAAAAPCDAGLTVVGIPVTGADCLVLGNGDIEIDTPRLLTNQAVEIRGKMTLNLNRTELRQKTTGVPLVVAVANSSGVYQPFFAGTFAVGNFQICEIGQTGAGSDAGATLSANGTFLETKDRLEVRRASIGCRTAPAIDVSQPALRFAAKLLKLNAAFGTTFSVGDDGVTVQMPNTFGLDEARGGRVFGNLQLLMGSELLGAPVTFAVGAEFSRDGGFQPTSIAVQYFGNIKTPIPGVVIGGPAFVFDPVNDRYGGRVTIQLPIKVGAGGELFIAKGKLESVGADVSLPFPGLPVAGPPPVITIQSIGFTFRPGTTTRAVAGTTTTSPFTLQGRTSFTAGPKLTIGGVTFTSVTGDVELTIQGPTLQLTGTLTAINSLITLGEARVLIGANPFRFEAEAGVKFPTQTNPVVDGRVFLGVTGSAFTGLGTVTIQIPPTVAVIGGKKLAGFSGVVSNKAIGGTIFVDPPLLQPRSIGAAFKYQGGFEIIDSIAPFITVQPTPTLSRVLAGGGRALFGTDGAGFDLAAGTGDVVVQVKGASTKPTGVSITGPDGKKVETFAFPATDATAVHLGIAKPKAGSYTVRGNGIAEVVVATLEDPAFLDPRPGYGTRSRGVVTAGTRVPVCWDIKNAPAGAVVDLFEDTNGFAATGRDLVVDQPASGCFEIDTTDWEPGRHWAYGLVRVGETPLGFRYWPIGITIVDPNRLAVPKGVKAKPILDGATISWKKVAGASGYLVTATPANPQDAPVVKQVSETDAVSLDISLRGAARWNVVVQPIADDGTLGNVSAVVTTGALTPVVLAGSPNGTPQVGEPWAFQLETANLRSLRLLASPKGTKLNRRTGLLTWTPSARAGTVAPQLLKVEGCAAKPRRCVTQEWYLSAYGVGFSPSGPARGFKVLDSVVEPGDVLEIRAQGIDEFVTVKVDGKRLRATILDQATVSVVLPRNLKQGPHDVSFRIGKDLEETLSGAIVVL